MPKEHKTSLELLQYAASIALYEKLVIQLKKDFSLANIALDLPDGITPLALKTILKEKIYVLLLERFPDYLNLLYIIDVPEKAFSSIKSTNVVEVAEGVSFLVLKREWQKVWLKQSYGTGGNGNKED
ncbi:hypothetical protein [uncultured Muriicola sp.]|uniref:hypothetical protein n=1 Tax=uncultured Muriicola sp. TaxID=1583102 RepID=UPI002619125E|nr:hypothetical protein [uncultured Muriicola sp.]